MNFTWNNTLDSLFATSLPVRKSSIIDFESVGKRNKFWFGESGSSLKIFKENLYQGEDWSEVLACEIAGVLSLPHATYNFAHLVDDNGNAMPDQQGVVTTSFVDSKQNLNLGNALLFDRDDSYPVSDENYYKAKKHTIEAISSVVQRLEPPLGVPQLAGLTALDFYAGYLFLDVLIANQDRHHENWGAIQHEGLNYLAPTFDHASCLARNVSDTEKLARMNTKDQGYRVESFVKRAKSAINVNSEGQRTLSTRDALKEFCQFNQVGVEAWQNRLVNVSSDQLSAIINKVPKAYMSEITRKFTLSMLEINRSYLLSL